MRARGRINNAQRIKRVINLFSEESNAISFGSLCESALFSSSPRDHGSVFPSFTYADKSMKKLRLKKRKLSFNSSFNDGLFPFTSDGGP